MSVDHEVPQVEEEDFVAVDSDSECCYQSRTRRESVGVDWCDLDETKTEEEEGMVVQPGSNYIEKVEKEF